MKPYSFIIPALCVISYLQSAIAELPPAAPAEFRATLQYRTASTNRQKFEYTSDGIGCVDPCPDIPKYFKTLVEQFDRSLDLCYENMSASFTHTIHWSTASNYTDVLTGTTSCSADNYTCFGFVTNNDLYLVESSGGITTTNHSYFPCCEYPDLWAGADGTNYCQSDGTDHVTLAWFDNYCQVGESESHGLLSDEYTTAELLSPDGFDYSGSWLTASETAPAYSSISAPNDSASIGKLQFQFKIVAPTGEAWELHYTIHYATDDGYYTNSEVVLRGNGPQTIGPIEYPPPVKTITSGSCTYYIGARKWVSIGCFIDVGSGGCGAQCRRTVGSFDMQNSDFGASVNASMGSDSFGQFSGSLQISAASPGSSFTSPSGLDYSGGLKGVELIQDGASLRQVKSAQALADIVTNSATSYDIRFYTNAGSFSSGLYHPSGSPFSSATIEQIGSTNHVRVTVTNGLTSVYDYEWSTADSGWTLTSGGGFRKETVSWNEATLVRTNTIKNASDQVLYRKVRYYTNLSGFGRVVRRQIVGPDGPALTTQWFYYDNSSSDGTNYGLIKMVIEPSGVWRKYQYDSNNLVTKITSQFLNAATDADDSLCRVVEFDYTPASGCSSERRVEKLLGQEISRQYSLDYGIEKWLVQCQTSGTTNLSAADNLVSVTRYYTNGDFVSKVWSVANPDGTMQIYRYATNSTQMTTCLLSGQPDPYGTNIVNGTKSITVTGPVGESISRTVIDIVSGITMSQETYSDWDTLSRPTRTDFLDGTYTLSGYACCGLDSTTERDGTVTSYAYDALKRQTASAKNGITISNIMDAAGNLLRTVRVGTDNSQITLSQSAYDTAGQITRQTNALGGITIYTTAFDGSGQTLRTNSYPDGGTRIETYYQDGSLQKVTGTATFPVRYTYGVASEGGVQGAYTAEIKLDTSGSDTPESATNYTDTIGRNYKTTYAAPSAPYPFSLSRFNNRGQLTNQLDPDGVSTLYTYNARGERRHTVIDVNTNCAVDFSGGDRITATTNDVLSSHSTYVRRTRTYAWPSDGSDTSIPVSTIEISTDGLQIWSTVWNDAGATAITTHTQTSFDPAHGYRIVTTTPVDGSYSVATNQYGRLISITHRDSPGAQIGQTLYGYDPHGRRNTITDARTGTTTNFFNNADQISGTATPTPAAGQPSQTTTNFFDLAGRVTATRLSDDTFVTNNYSPTGLLTNTFGSRTYPVAYTYDAQGRMKTMKTWKNYSSGAGAATTTWNYDLYRGWLTNKTYDGGSPGPNYGYTAGGRLSTRAWARGITTTYAYSGAGDLVSASYSDGTTPTISYGYDRRGRRVAVTNGPTVCTIDFDDTGNVLSEAYSGGPLAEFSVATYYDGWNRRLGTDLLQYGGEEFGWGFSYDDASRLQEVEPDADSAGLSVSYSRLANSSLMDNIVFQRFGVTKMSRTNKYDAIDRLTNLTWRDTSNSVASFAYQNNNANQRTSLTNSDDSYWQYTYDSLGQVTSGKKYWSDGTPAAGQQFEYAFDDIGNRKTAASGGDQWGANLRYENYSANSLNQYTSRSVPGFVQVLGSANSNATVTVNNQPVYRHSEYFRAELAEDNTASALWLSLTNVAVLPNGTNSDIVTNTVGNAFLAQTPEIFAYDPDGNLTNDGRWAFTWDAENRLTSLQSRSDGPTGSKLKMDFTYDYLGRRIQKIVSTNNGSSYIPQYTNLFTYDGWNLIGILDANGTALCSFSWGLDASGTIQGAGGVGGVLWMGIHSGPNAGYYLYAYDGNHNVTALIRYPDGVVVAQYEYGPFGELVRAAGPMARTNPFRFSTKYQDGETDLLYYGYRHYNATTGRWLNRDPLGEPAFELMANRPKRRTITPEKLHLMKALAELRAINPTLAMRIIDEYPQLTEGFDTEGDPNVSNPYMFVKNDPSSNLDVLGLDLWYHYCLMSCPSRCQVGYASAWTLWPVPDSVLTRCCGATERFFCATVMPPGAGNWAAALVAAGIYFQGCVMFPRP